MSLGDRVLRGLIASFGLFHVLMPLLGPRIILASFIDPAVHLALIELIGVLTLLSLRFPRLSLPAALLYVGSALAEVAGVVAWGFGGEAVRAMLASFDLATASALIARKK